MKWNPGLRRLMLLGLALSPSAYADAYANESTMAVVESDVTEIEYLEHLAPNDHAAFGTEVSNAVRHWEAEDERREIGEWVAGQRRQNDVAHDVQVRGQRNERAALRGANGQGQRPE